jgi:hypothetical protein
MLDEAASVLPMIESETKRNVLVTHEVQAKTEMRDLLSRYRLAANFNVDEFLDENWAEAISRVQQATGRQQVDGLRVAELFKQLIKASIPQPTTEQE